MGKKKQNKKQLAEVAEIRLLKLIDEARTVLAEIRQRPYTLSDLAEIRNIGWDRNGMTDTAPDDSPFKVKTVQTMNEFLEATRKLSDQARSYVDEKPEARSVRDTFAGPGWRETMKATGFQMTQEDDAQLRKTAQAIHADVEKRYGVEDQPAPVANDAPSAHDLVVDDILQRKEFGLAKYGTLLQPGNGRKSLQDAYEEFLDGACYMRCLIEEQKDRSKPQPSV